MPRKNPEDRARSPASVVRDTGGKALQPFDVVWKALLPGFRAITSLEIDGQRGAAAVRVETSALRRITAPEPVRRRACPPWPVPRTVTSDIYNQYLF